MPFIGAVEYALWRTVDAMGHHMEACKHDPNERAAHSADQNATARTAEQEELALKLAGLLMPALRSCVKGSGRRAVICCKVLAGLMPSSKASLLCKKSLLSCSKRVSCEYMIRGEGCFHMLHSVNVLWCCAHGHHSP